MNSKDRFARFETAPSGAFKDRFRIYQKNDGNDYLTIFRHFIKGEIQAVAFSNTCSERKVYFFNYQGRGYILKTDQEVDQRLEKRLWRRLNGSFRLKLIKQVNRAVERGCPFLQDIYLVAERLEGGAGREAYLLAEYIPGRTLHQVPKPDAYYPALAETVTELHKFGLASNDIHPGNILVTANGLKIIDLSNTGLTLVGKANDLIALEKNFGLKLKPQNQLEALMVGLLRLKERFRRFKRRLKGLN